VHNIELTRAKLKQMRGCWF